MNKVYIFGLMFLLCLSTVLGAKVVDDGRSSKPLVEIENCYNLTVQYDLTDGNATGISFDGCSDKGNNTWFCLCKDSKFWNLTMRTDRTVLRNPRQYDMTLTYNLYNIYSNSDDFDVDDWGDYADQDGLNIKYSNSSSRCQSQIKVIEYNKTVEVIKYENIIEYRDRLVYINQTIENTSMIIQLNGALLNASEQIIELKGLIAEKDKETKTNTRWGYVAVAILILCFIFIIYLVFIKRA